MYLCCMQDNGVQFRRTLKKGNYVLHSVFGKIKKNLIQIKPFNKVTTSNFYSNQLVATYIFFPRYQMKIIIISTYSNSGNTDANFAMTSTTMVRPVLVRRTYFRDGGNGRLSSKSQRNRKGSLSLTSTVRQSSFVSLLVPNWHATDERTDGLGLHARAALEAFYLNNACPSKKKEPTQRNKAGPGLLHYPSYLYVVVLLRLSQKYFLPSTIKWEVAQ